MGTLMNDAWTELNPKQHPEVIALPPPVVPMAAVPIAVEESLLSRWIPESPKVVVDDKSEHFLANLSNRTIRAIVTCGGALVAFVWHWHFVAFISRWIDVDSTDAHIRDLSIQVSTVLSTYVTPITGALETTYLMYLSRYKRPSMQGSQTCER